MKFHVSVAAAACAALAAGICLAQPGAATAREAREQAATLSDNAIYEIRRAIDEGRLLDAGQLIDQSTAAGSKDPRLHLASGELGLARGRLEMAIKDFEAAAANPATAADGLQGKGVALARMGRTEEAISVLKRTVEMSPQSWRAWNALGVQYDRQKDWADAADAYDRAIAASSGAPAVLNNRGYSRLLQGRYDLAVDDFVAALDRKPDLAEARTNLRLALAFRGEYKRSITAGPMDDRAALLNNAGFAAGVRGDYAKAEELLDEAMKVRTQHYDRAAENLKLVEALKSEAGTVTP
jgi:Flp pilus assembly protein TadD